MSEKKNRTQMCKPRNSNFHKGESPKETCYVLGVSNSESWQISERSVKTVKMAFAAAEQRREKLKEAD